MYKNATVSFYSPVIAKNSEGTPIKTWSYVTALDTVRADVQPKRLSPEERKLYGLSNANSDAKVFLGKVSAYTAENNRVKVVSDFDGTTAYYDIRATNPWPRHIEMILIPVQGE